QIAMKIAYKKDTTHKWITDQAISYLIAKNLIKYANLESYREQLVDGSHDEDDTPRYLNHYFRPTDGKGLSFFEETIPIIYSNSWEWGGAG
ncbi:hypothetical protein ACFL30_02965, partial [Candidatus Latescibacterota bacterium]